jgi:hypothetical protein
VLATILIVVLTALLLASLPFWRHSKTWGYYPSIGIAMFLVLVINLAFKGRL